MKKDLLYLKKLFSKPFRATRAGGQTNRNYIVSFNKQKFFVRLPWEGVLDRRMEGRNILALSKNKTLKSILPQYYVYVLNKKNILGRKNREVFNVPDGTMVTEFLDGREFTMKDFRQEKYQKALASMLHVFHTSGVRFINPYNVFRDEVRKYRKRTPRSWWERFFDGKTRDRLITLEREAENILPSLKQGTPTHNDFLFQNFLLGADKKLYLLDFEYAGMNQKGGILYDFGFLFADNLFRKPSITKELFEEFLKTADKVYKRTLDREQIYWSAVAAILVQIWWGAIRYSSVSKQEQPYFRTYTQKRIQGISRLTQGLKKRGARI